MIVTRIHGGLGNQMFQYAVGRRAAVKSGVPLGPDLTAMAKYRKRSYGLDQFVLTKDAQPVDGEAFSRGRGVTRLLRYFRKFSLDRYEIGFPFDPEILELKPPVRLVGYWQSEKYFSDMSDLIRSEFALVKPISPERQIILDRIQTCNAVSVHVRRGDYVSVQKNKAIFGSCEPEWYKRATAIASDGMADPVFFVFSDDIPWAMQHLELRGTAVWVEPLPGGRDAEDLHLMAACRSHVIANSSFSWWGAWLDSRREARVVAPSRWFSTDALDARDIVPMRWIRL